MKIFYDAIKIEKEKIAILNKSQRKSRQFSRGLRIGCLTGLFAVVIIGAISVPFVYESQTLWYKIGIDKTMLRSGKIAGLIAATLLFVQILLGVRGQFLEKLFSVAGLVRYHRINGGIILFLALIHVILVLLPEGFSNLPIGLKFWPEMIGGVLFWIIIIMVISSRLREQLGLVYGRWRIIHKSLAYSALALIGVHILFVSESFEHIIPRTVLMVVLAGVGIMVMQVKITAFLKKRQSRRYK